MGSWKGPDTATLGSIHRNGVLNQPVPTPISNTESPAPLAGTGNKHWCRRRQRVLSRCARAARSARKPLGCSWIRMTAMCDEYGAPHTSQTRSFSLKPTAQRRRESDHSGLRTGRKVWVRQGMHWIINKRHSAEAEEMTWRRASRPARIPRR
ncbi:hypothetical protein FA95DRAFT_107338 [Auriscalpium vulgare]|uniref:Uncharacterized protein n=1 Tax=Auriscalpium vulgare TaxID=40419 RepID=A0ACB8S705_9AGAM|nr:hypothetical protein FA95DRAFT_107338 [Auriscalpium vulgare]